MTRLGHRLFTLILIWTFHTAFPSKRAPRTKPLISSFAAGT